MKETERNKSIITKDETPQAQVKKKHNMRKDKSNIVREIAKIINFSHEKQNKVELI